MVVKSVSVQPVVRAAADKADAQVVADVRVQVVVVVQVAVRVIQAAAVGETNRMNRPVLITGATRGIGRALVKQLTALGFPVFGTGRDEQLLETLKAETGCQGATADLTDPAQAVRIYQQATEAMGTIDILINNAGLNNRKAPVSEIELDDWELQYALNLRAPMLLSREAIKDMGERKRGHIVNVISTIAKTSQPNYSIYSAIHLSGPIGRAR